MSARVLGRSGLPLLIVGGLDPLGASGVLADVRALHGLAVWPLVVVSALTEQPHRVVAAPLFEASLRQALAQRPAAMKVGMLANAGQAHLVAELIGKIPLVLDPVLMASSGLRLYGSAPHTLQSLIAKAALVTPNTSEAQALHALLPDARAVLYKGGHGTGTRVTDTLRTAHAERHFTALRRPYSVRGTGCALASRIAGELASGHALEKAVARAERWLQRQYKSARPASRRDILSPPQPRG